jgi:cation diffusion facilitator CzcD-associated flavoprotein CzcO
VLTDAKLTVPGIYNFEGPMLHSAEWDPSVDFKDKNVALIGNGSSAVQLLPQLQARASHIDNYVRNPTWITPSFGSDILIQVRPLSKFRATPHTAVERLAQPKP